MSGYRKVVLFTDACVYHEGSPGGIAAGAYWRLVKEGDQERIFERGFPLGIARSQAAEIMAIHTALLAITDRARSRVVLHCDSQSAIYRLSHPVGEHKGLLLNIRGIAQEFDRFEAAWQPRRTNMAHQAARAALAASILTLPVDHPFPERTNHGRTIAAPDGVDKNGIPYQFGSAKTRRRLGRFLTEKKE